MQKIKETIIEVLYRISQTDNNDFVSNAAIFFLEPINLDSPARICNDKNHVGGWHIDQGDYGFGDGMRFFTSVSNAKGFMYSDMSILVFFMKF